MMLFCTNAAGGFNFQMYALTQRVYTIYYYYCICLPSKYQ